MLNNNKFYIIFINSAQYLALMRFFDLYGLILENSKCPRQCFYDG